MALPASRNFTYTVGAAIRSIDLNELQDWVIYFYARRHAEDKLIISPRAFVVESGTGTVTGPQVSMGSVTAGNACAPLNLRVGDRIRSFLFYATFGTDDFDFRIRRVPRATPGSPVTVATVNASVGGETASGSIDHTVLEDSTYYFELLNGGGGSGNMILSYLELTIDRPV
jgi:hypothetical protein